MAATQGLRQDVSMCISWAVPHRLTYRLHANQGVSCWLQTSESVYLSSLHLQSTNGGLGLDRLQALPLLQLTDAQPVMPQAEVNGSSCYTSFCLGSLVYITRLLVKLLPEGVTFPFPFLFSEVSESQPWCTGRSEHSWQRAPAQSCVT